ncbi:MULTISPECIES: hypothetical protein [Olivibacter]|uniref:Uncharacterized protein n=1 Tax=Olivibacter jilunii TaxID=985016 RepID=A0ABW6B2J8_9SPHI
METQQFIRTYDIKLDFKISEGYFGDLFGKELTAHKRSYGGMHKERFLRDLSESDKIQKYLVEKSRSDKYWDADTCRRLLLQVYDLFRKERDNDDHWEIHMRLLLPDLNCIKIVDGNNFVELDEKGFVRHYTIVDGIRIQIKQPAESN